MFDFSGFEKTVIGTAIVLLFAILFVVNDYYQRLIRRLDKIDATLDGLREYLYERDPQFDDERALLKGLDDAVNSDSFSLDGMHHMDLVREKNAAGKRTLNDSL